LDEGELFIFFFPWFSLVFSIFPLFNEFYQILLISHG